MLARIIQRASDNNNRDEGIDDDDDDAISMYNAMELVNDQSK